MFAIDVPRPSPPPEPRSSPARVHSLNPCPRYAAFTPAAVPTIRGNTAVCANKFGQSAPAGAPPADLFNIWRDDYMLTPAQAAAEVRTCARVLVFEICSWRVKESVPITERQARAPP